ncbi:hypothetical protein MTX26_23950 [Bradyrhizobium sp. ISRA443]|uniref:hypothetical protein n=1 Tax=unclassified Bradyrhizobium TaxID=2631580 RepID=UPI002478D36A|nr:MULTISPECIES: hypothetical protein [unclassified Bradyrhizobium]WGR92959.1 hypothetical protein MTX20_34840 [Bradyrhizobium sp. ISRA435]WGR97453.1 hypothetical protein MTX23_23945 [Bradyrhizobium sp. ISRA436]WGS04341.1 hypothetical protein MTX18_23945 [Bradyrhizobium sp. ISRA437]WGS11225.1 hypothetical protein MTX26_23950 [Bradyrhizobium sp. ISRA443]
MAGTGSNAADEVDVLHYIVTAFREDWKPALLGFATLLLLGAAGVMVTLKTSYSSRAVLSLPPSVQALIKTDAVLDPVLKNTHLKELPVPIEVARDRLADAVTVSPELTAATGLHWISVSDETPEYAHAVLQQLIESLFAASMPRGTSREFILEQIRNQSAALSNLKALARALQEKAKTVEGGSEGERYARAMVALVSDIANKENQLWQLGNNLRGMQSSDIIVPPTVATIPNSRQLWAKLVVVLTFASLLTFGLVLFLHEWRRRYSRLQRALSVASTEGASERAAAQVSLR